MTDNTKSLDSKAHFSQVYLEFIQIVGHILDHKTNFNKFRNLKIRNEREDFKMDTTERSHDSTMNNSYSLIFDNLKEMDKFLETYNLSKLKQNMSTLLKAVSNFILI